MSRTPTHDVLWSVDDAIAFLQGEQKSRSTSWRRMCLSLAAHAYGYAASGTSDSDRDGNPEAIEYWKQSAFQHPDDRRPPVGGLACWESTTAGHIAVVVQSNRNGVFVLCNDEEGDVRRFALSFFEDVFHQTYMGWAEPNFPNGAPGNPFGLPEATDAEPVFREALFLGNENSQSVRALQRRLKDIVNSELEVTGAYDRATRAAVRTFQQRCRFSGDGADGLIWDPEEEAGGQFTLRMLFPRERYLVRDGNVPGSDSKEPDEPVVAEHPDPDEPGTLPVRMADLPVVDPEEADTKPKVKFGALQPGKANKSVRVLQERLNKISDAGLEVTGTYDEATRAAVQAWQIAIGDVADADGLLGPRQFARLFPVRAFDRAAEDPGGLRLSDRGAEFIAEFEGFKKELYNDPAGHCTIGVGHLVHLGRCNGSEPANFKNGLTDNEVIALLQRDAVARIDCVASNVKVPLNQAQFDALVSFVFNVGEGAFETSTLLKELNQGHLDQVPVQLNRWNKATIGGQLVVLNGLTRRRGREGRLFSTGSYTA